MKRLGTSGYANQQLRKRPSIVRMPGNIVGNVVQNPSVVAHFVILITSSKSMEAAVVSVFEPGFEFVGGILVE